MALALALVLVLLLVPVPVLVLVLARGLEPRSWLVRPRPWPRLRLQLLRQPPSEPLPQQHQ